MMTLQHTQTSATLDHHRYARFEADWSPADYLEQYYREVQPDEQITMRFLVEAAALIGDCPRMIEFGSGPTVHHLLPFAPRAESVHVVDFLQSNLDTVRMWLAGGDDAWDWSPFTRLTLDVERCRPPTEHEIAEREATLRERIDSLGLADARCRQPLRDGWRRYPVVLCCFCPDSITSDRDDWHRCAAHIASLVAPGGWLVLTALGHARSYRVGGHHFPSAGVSADDIVAMLDSAGFARLGRTVATVATSDPADHGFDHVLLAVSRKPVGG